jgi:hypothetical protein
MITTIGNRHRNIIEFKFISKNYNRSNMLRRRYSLLLLLLYYFFFPSLRGRLERKLLHIP